MDAHLAQSMLAYSQDNKLCLIVLAFFLHKTQIFSPDQPLACNLGRVNITFLETSQRNILTFSRHFVLQIVLACFERIPPSTKWGTVDRTKNIQLPSQRHTAIFSRLLVGLTSWKIVFRWSTSKPLLVNYRFHMFWCHIYRPIFLLYKPKYIRIQGGGEHHRSCQKQFCCLYPVWRTIEISKPRFLSKMYWTNSLAWHAISYVLDHT